MAAPIVILAPGLVPGHLGALHPFETVLTLVLAFGPLVGIAILILVRRRHDIPDQDPAADGAAEGIGVSSDS